MWLIYWINSQLNLMCSHKQLRIKLCNGNVKCIVFSCKSDYDNQNERVSIFFFYLTEKMDKVC